MRADNNWEDKVGKRLYDFEGELSPQAWNNISKKIQPKRRNRWFMWLPLILVLLSVPAGLYYSGKLKTLVPGVEKPSGNVSTNSPSGKEIAIIQPSKISETVAETDQNVTDTPVQKENLTYRSELQEKTNEVTNSETDHTFEGTEQTAINSNSPSEFKQPKKNAFVLIPGRETTKLPTVKQKSETETSENKSKARKPGFNSTATITARSTKKNAGNTISKTGINPEEKVTESGNSVARNNSNTASSAKLISKNSEAEFLGKNSASGKTTVEQPEKIKTELAQETAGINEQNEKTIQESNATNIKELTKASLAKIESSNPYPVVSDSVFSKQDSLAVKNIAQKDTAATKPDPKKKQWAFSVYGAPQYTFQRVQPNETDDTKILRLNNKNDFETERLGYEFGVRGYYPLNDKLQLAFGFQFARVAQHLSFTTASQFADSAVVTQQGYNVNMQVYNRELKQLYLIKYTLAGLYTGLNTTIGNNFNLNGGLGLNWILSSKTSPASTQITSAASAPYLSAGLNYNWNISPTLKLQAGPNVQYYLKPLQNKEGLFCTQPTVFGFNVGLLFHSKP